MNSHIEVARHIGPINQSGVKVMRIFRQGFEFLEPQLEGSGFRAGLNFVGFQSRPQNFFQALVYITDKQLANKWSGPIRLEQFEYCTFCRYIFSSPL